MANYDHYPYGVEAPATYAMPITPSDVDDLPRISRAIYVGTTGDIMIALAGKQCGPVKFKAVPAGTVLALFCKKIYATGTTADDLVAIW